MPFTTRSHDPRIGVVAALLFFFSLTSYGAERIAEEGFRHFYNLEYDDAIAAFRQEIAGRPTEADGYNHFAQAILYRGLYRSGILENSLVSGDDFLLSVIRQPKLVLKSTDEEEFKKAIATAVETSQARLRSEPDNTAALYSLGVSYGLQANYDILVRKAWLAAIRESTAARKLHNRVSELDPDNIDARMMQGVQDYVVASLPRALRFLGAITGIRGDKDSGLSALEDVANRGANSQVEAQMLLATLYRHEKKPSSALAVLSRLRRNYPRNYLLHLAEVYTYIEMRDERSAVESIGSLDRRRAEGTLGYGLIQSGKVDFTKGVIQCRFGHLDHALEAMNRVAGDAQFADRQTRLLAVERLGMIHDLRGERQLALQAYQKVVDSDPSSEIARESQKYLFRPFRGCNSD